jgi:hypothetical protein
VLFDRVFIDGDDVTFSYHFGNYANTVTEDKIVRAIKAGLLIAMSLADVGEPWTSIAAQLLDEVHYVFSMCDGPVIDWQVSWTQAELEALVPADANGNGFRRFDLRHDGMGSPDGCGENSLYFSAFTIKRELGWTWPNAPHRPPPPPR